MKWILIYYLLANSGNFAATGTATFDDEAACNAALDVLAAKWPDVGQGVSQAQAAPSGMMYFSGAQTQQKPGICVAQATAPEVPTVTPPILRPAIPGIPATKGR